MLLYHNCRALVSLDVSEGNAVVIAILVVLWVTSFLSVLISYMGPGHFLSNVAIFILFLIFVLRVLIFVYCGNRNNNTTSKLQRCTSFGLGAFSVLTGLFFPPCVAVLFPFWIVAGLVYAAHVFQTKLRALQRDAQDDTERRPSPIVWQRMDRCLVFTIKCIGVLIVIGYLFFIYLLLQDFSFSSLEAIWLFLTTNALFGALLYLLVVTLLVRNRPQRQGQRPGTSDSVAVMRQARQFVIDPDDPMAEPLLLI